MKKFGIRLVYCIALVVMCLVVVYQYKFPYHYLPLPKYWSVEKIGFRKIQEPDHFTLYYMDKMDVKGYDKKLVRYSAMHQAYRSSKEGSYVNIAALISLSHYAETTDDAVVLQKYLLNNHLDFENRCYNYMCGKAHSINRIATDYARNMKKKRYYDEAFNTLKTIILSRKNDLEPWVRFGDLEEVYFLLNEMSFSNSQLQFFDSELSELEKIQTSEKLEKRYRNLIIWKEKLHEAHTEQNTNAT